MKIYFIEPTGITIDEAKASLPGHEVVEIDSRSWSDEKLILRVHDADVLALANRLLSAAVITTLHELKLIAVAVTGTDHVDHVAASVRHIPIKSAARTASEQNTGRLTLNQIRAFVG